MSAPTMDAKMYAAAQVFEVPWIGLVGLAIVFGGWFAGYRFPGNIPVGLVAIGLVLGVLLALALRQVLAGMLFGVAATDPIIFASVVVVLSVVSLMACYLPARRATRIDPLVALRSE